MDDTVSSEISALFSDLYHEIDSFDDETQLKMLRLFERLVKLIEKRDTLLMSLIELKVDDIIHTVKILEFDLWATKLERDRYRDNA